jgi:hypothetical protein
MTLDEWTANKVFFEDPSNKSDIERRDSVWRREVRRVEERDRAAEILKYLETRNMALPESEQLSYPELRRKSRHWANESMRGLAALHNPDKKAGGPIEQGSSADFGDAGVNKSVGSQWRGLADAKLRPWVEAQTDLLEEIPNADSWTKLNTELNWT